VDLHHFHADSTYHPDADPDADSTYHPHADPASDFYLTGDPTLKPDADPDPDLSFQIKAQILEKVLK
jgi:hypothetical protein